jgi:hypothetical protein
MSEAQIFRIPFHSGIQIWNGDREVVYIEADGLYVTLSSHSFINIVRLTKMRPHIRGV